MADIPGIRAMDAALLPSFDNVFVGAYAGGNKIGPNPIGIAAFVERLSATGALGTGNVTGPVSASTDRIVTFASATGKVVKDSGIMISAIAMLNSPAFAGTPTAPTAAGSTNNTQIATTAFVQAAASGRVAKAGDTMNGTLSISVSAWPTFRLNRATDGNGAQIEIQKNGLADWTLRGDDNSFFIGRFVGGVYQNAPIHVLRDTGAVRIGTTDVISTLNGSFYLPGGSITLAAGNISLTGSVTTSSGVDHGYALLRGGGGPLNSGYLEFHQGGIRAGYIGYANENTVFLTADGGRGWHITGPASFVHSAFAPTAAQTADNTQLATTAFATLKTRRLTNFAVDVLTLGAAGNAATDDYAVFASAIAASGRVVVPGGRNYYLSANPAPAGGTKTIHWDIDPTSTFSGPGTDGFSDFLYTRTNWAHKAIGPYYFAYRPDHNTPVPGGFSYFTVELEAHPGNVARQTATAYFGAAGSSPHASANVWSMNTLIAAEGAAAGIYQGYELDVNSSAPNAWTFGLSVTGAGTHDTHAAISVSRATNKWIEGLVTFNTLNGYTYNPIAGGTAILVKSLTGSPTTSSATVLSARQQANNTTMLFLQRETDSSPAGNFYTCVNAANTSLLAILDVYGNHTISGFSTAAGLIAGTGNIEIVGPASSARIIRFKTGSVIRWTAGANVEAESGADTGSDFVINRYDDGGAFLGNSFRIDRATGDIFLERDLAVARNASFNGLIDVAAAGGYYVGGQKIVGARKTGWATASGTASRATFATGTVTLPQLAERVKALIDDLHSTAGHGLITA